MCQDCNVIVVEAALPGLDRPAEGLHDRPRPHAGDPAHVRDPPAGARSAIEVRARPARLGQHATSGSPAGSAPDVVGPGDSDKVEVWRRLALVQGARRDHVIETVEGCCIDGVEVERRAVGCHDFCTENPAGKIGERKSGSAAGLDAGTGRSSYW